MSVEKIGFCEWCGDPIVATGEAIVTSGGWCAPSETIYDFPRPALCSDCHARWVMVLELGIDPGRRGENLRFPRGGIQYKRGDES